jgi:hypothetical protein
MPLIMISNIRKDEHLADVQCVGGIKNEQPCSYSESDWDINTDMEYSKNPDGSDNVNFIVVQCPNCGMASTYPTNSEGNTVGFALGQAKASQKSMPKSRKRQK